MHVFLNSVCFSDAVLNGHVIPYKCSLMLHDAFLDLKRVDSYCNLKQFFQLNIYPYSFKYILQQLYNEIVFSLLKSSYIIFIFQIRYPWCYPSPCSLSRGRLCTIFKI